MPHIELESFDLNAAEKRLVETALQAGGSIVLAAQLLGVTRHAVKRRIIKHQIMWPLQSDAPHDGALAVAVPMTSEPLRPVATLPTRSSPHVNAALKTFSWIAVFAPRRVWQEETGDALEVISAMEWAGCSALKIRLKVWATIFWVLLNGLREIIAGLKGRK